jgi:hypothetical protein
MELECSFTMIKYATLAALQLHLLQLLLHCNVDSADWKPVGVNSVCHAIKRIMLNVFWGLLKKFKGTLKFQEQI